MDVPPHNLKEQMTAYRDCIGEARLRLELAKARITDRKCAGVVTEFDIESISLHLRKVVELIALGSISANKVEYEKVRADIGRDWNARLIFRDVERINPSFFPIPFEFDGDASMKEPTYKCMDREGLMELYDKTSQFMHSRNRYAPLQNYGYVLEDLAGRVDLLINLLRSFEVHLLPSDYLYFVVMNFRTEDPVQVALAGYIDDEHDS
jgi:hypothetical protein